MLFHYNEFPRFWSKVGVGASDECWLWQAHTDRDGYGTFSLNDRKVRAHKVSYELIKGAVPKGLELDHLCRIPQCVYPEHLEPVTHRENVLRGVSPNAKSAQVTHCPKGHLYDMLNTRIDPKGGRNCRQCGRDQCKRYYRRKKQESGATQWTTP